MKRTTLVIVLVALTTTIVLPTNHYQDIFAKPQRQKIGLGLSCLTTFFSVRSLIRSFRSRQPGVALLATAGIASSIASFIAIEKVSPKPFFISNKRFPELAKMGNITKTMFNTSPHHNAVDGLVYKLQAGSKLALNGLVDTFDDIVSECVDKQDE